MRPASRTCAFRSCNASTFARRTCWSASRRGASALEDHPALPPRRAAGAEGDVRGADPRLRALARGPTSPSRPISLRRSAASSTRSKRLPPSARQRPIPFLNTQQDRDLTGRGPLAVGKAAVQARVADAGATDLAQGPGLGRDAELVNAQPVEWFEEPTRYPGPRGRRGAGVPTQPCRSPLPGGQGDRGRGLSVRCPSDGARRLRGARCPGSAGPHGHLSKFLDPIVE